METKDYKKELKIFYAPSAKEISCVDVPSMNFLKLDGQGNPNTAPAFQEATEALFSVAYTLKFMVKKGPLALDYGVMPLEGLWWSEDMADFTTGNKDAWSWTLMIMQPDPITARMVEEAQNQSMKKKGNPAISRLRFEPYHEGKAAQIMHIGPFSTEGPTIAKLHAFIADQGSQLQGLHHEIYLSDIRRANPEKWKTVIRQPMI